MSLRRRNCFSAWFGRHRLPGWAGAVTAMATVAVLLLAPSISLAAVPPPNDNYLASTIITQAETTGTHYTTFHDTQDTSAATTQPDLFNPDQLGGPGSGGGPEPLTCNGSSYGSTIWYDLHPKVPGGLELTAAGFATSIALYQWSPVTKLITRRIGCQVSTSLSNDFALGHDLQKGKLYTVQIGGLKTASGSDSVLLDFMMTFVPDHDGDTVFDGLDKCPFLAGVQRFGGCPPAIQPIPRLSYDTVGPAVRFTSLRLDQIPGGAQVIARCRQCGLRQVRQAGPHASSVTMTAFAGRTLPAGAKLEIWVTKRATGTGNYHYGAFGSYISVTVNSGVLGDRVLRCLMPGSLTPRRTCPPGGRRSLRSHLGRRVAMPGTARAFPIEPFAASIP